MTYTFLKAQIVYFPKKLKVFNFRPNSADNRPSSARVEEQKFVVFAFRPGHMTLWMTDFGQIYICSCSNIFLLRKKFWGQKFLQPWNYHHFWNFFPGKKLFSNFFANFSKENQKSSIKRNHDWRFCFTIDAEQKKLFQNFWKKNRPEISTKIGRNPVFLLYY